MKKFSLLILEDDVVTSITLQRNLQNELPDVSFLRAGTLFEARLLLASFDIDFFLLDIQLPDGSGIDFILDISSVNPTAGVVIMTATPLPKHRDRATAYGALHFFEKPISPRTLGQIIRTRRAASGGEAGGSDTSFTASLTRLTVMDVIQLKCLARATLRLDFTLRDGRTGSIYFREGEILHAEASAGSAEAEGKVGLPALAELLTWHAGRVEEVRDCELPAPTLHRSWQATLLEAAQMADEQAKA